MIASSGGLVLARFPFMLPRFLSDPSMPAGERLLVSLPASGMPSIHSSLKYQDITGDEQALMDPLSILFIKGWTRSFCALCLMAACFESTEFFEAGGRLHDGQL